MKYIEELWKKMVLYDTLNTNNHYLNNIHISYNNINSNYFSQNVNTIFFQIFDWYKNNNRILLDINYLSFKEFMYHNNTYYNECINSIFL